MCLHSSGTPVGLLGQKYAHLKISNSYYHIAF